MEDATRFRPMIAHGGLCAAVQIGHGADSQQVQLTDTNHQLLLQVPARAVGEILVTFREALRAQPDQVHACQFVELRRTHEAWLLSVPDLPLQPINRLDDSAISNWLAFLGRVHAALLLPPGLNSSRA